MAKEFDRQKFLANIRALIRQRGMKIGELESNVDLSAGYLSRLERDDNKAIPSVDVVWKIANELGVNIELLIEGNFDHSTENIEYIRRFVQSLFDRTVGGELEWSSNNIGSINRALEGKEECAIVEHAPDGEYFEPSSGDMYQYGVDTGSQMRSRLFRIRSLTRPTSEVIAADSCFHVQIGNNQVLHLFKFTEVMFDDDPDLGGTLQAIDYYELAIEEIIYDHEELSPVCNTLWNTASLKPDIEKLYQELKEHEYDLRIDKRVRGIIDAFMGISNNDFTTVDDDELPF